MNDKIGYVFRNLSHYNEKSTVKIKSDYLSYVMQHRVARLVVTYFSEKVAASVFRVTEQAKHHKDDTDAWRETTVTMALGNKHENGKECTGAFSKVRVNIRNGS